MSHFTEPYNHSKHKINVELDLSNYATKPDLENAAGTDTSYFAKMADLASLNSDAEDLDFDALKNVPNGLKNLKSKVDKSDDDNLKTVPIDLRKISDAVDENVLEKSKCSADKNGLDKK